MGIREIMDQKKGATQIVAVVLILIGIGLIVKELMPPSRMVVNQVYYTTDDGKNWFADDLYKIPPYDKGGQTAVRAHVLTYDNGSKRFCAYLTKWTPDAQKQLQDAVAEAAKNGQPAGSVSLFSDRGFNESGTLYKKPNDPTAPWLDSGQASAKGVLTYVSPDKTETDDAVP